MNDIHSANSLNEYTKEVVVSDSHKLFQYLSKFAGKNFVFRGQSCAEWGLRSSLERASVHNDIDMQHAEPYLCRTFQRRAHHYLSNRPAADDSLEWMALMQHHGVPTRLLDWTFSHYVALFFALAQADRKYPSAVWAVDYIQLKRSVIETLRACLPDLSLSTRDALGLPHIANITINGDANRLPPRVVPVRPFRMNERLAIQQGTFLCHTSTKQGFEASLRDTLQFLRDLDENRATIWVHRIIIQPKARETALAELNRMNINYASLFPGLDGHVVCPHDVSQMQ